ncbi:MAG: YbjQ family protein [Bdellovibrionales bacterium]
MFNLLVVLTLLILGFVIGSAREKKHFESLRKREGLLSAIPWRSNGKKEDFSKYQEGSLVTGHVVIGQDYFKAFLAGLVNLVGGRMSSYESLLDRGRREALCRLRESARDWECREIVNVRFETSIIGENQGKQKSGAIEVFAYGTALK